MTPKRNPGHKNRPGHIRAGSCKITKLLEIPTGFDTFAPKNSRSDMTIIFATGNRHKLREASEILGEGFELVTPADKGIAEDIPETGNTLKENSLQKAQYIFDHTGGADCFADDTGLEVDVLDGAPGVYSARYAGNSKDFNANSDKLLREMALKEHEASFAREFGINAHTDRKARFRTVVTLILNGEKHFFEGVMEGRIAFGKTGNGGFGYDPVFIADEYPDVSVAELTEEQKNAISHRGKALMSMAEFLKNVRK